MNKLFSTKLGPIAAATSLLLALVACGSKSKLEGTYSQRAGGTVALDLRPGGKANFSMMGEDYPCTYKVDGKKLALDCSPKGEKVDFTIHDDGLLSGPSFVGVLKKSE